MFHAAAALEPAPCHLLALKSSNVDYSALLGLDAGLSYVPPSPSKEWYVTLAMCIVALFYHEINESFDSLIFQIFQINYNNFPDNYILT